ncbi:hypothetical protein M0R45_009024 [Rubus argutus]|uniref:Uncharacterized protein n=1 Tax=Rubus argutus TaxID=59490 RepID=A0AAW1Y3B6_RUBAR
MTRSGGGHGGAELLRGSDIGCKGWARAEQHRQRLRWSRHGSRRRQRCLAGGWAWQGRLGLVAKVRQR